MGVTIIENVIQSIDGLFCIICDGIFWCFRFIEILPRMFSFIHQLLSLFLDLNHAIFTGVFGFIKSLVDHGKQIKSIFMFSIEVTCNGIVGAVGNTVDFIHQSSANATLSCLDLYTMAIETVQHFLSGMQSISLKSIISDLLVFLENYCVLFAKVFSGILKLLLKIFIDIIRNVALFFERHVETLGKWLIDIFLLKPLNMLAKTGELIINFGSSSWRSTTNSSTWLASQLMNSFTSIYQAVLPVWKYSLELILLPFTLVKELITGLISSNSTLGFALSMLCLSCVAVVVLSSQWFCEMMQRFSFGRQRQHRPDFLADGRDNYHHIRRNVIIDNGDVDNERDNPGGGHVGYAATGGSNRKNSDNGGDFPDCVICQDKKRTILILPCRHLCVCTNCIRRLLDMRPNLKNCPLCRTHIEGHMDVYL